MRRNPGGFGATGHAMGLRRTLQPYPFIHAPWQWAVIEAVHGSFSSTLYAAATAGTQTVQLNAKPSVNDYLLIGTLQNTPIQVTAVTGTSAPYTATLAIELPSNQASAAAVAAAKTLDMYPDGTQSLSNTAYLIPGVRYLSGYSPTVGDVVIVLRGQYGQRTDRLCLGKPA